MKNISALWILGLNSRVNLIEYFGTALAEHARLYCTERAAPRTERAAPRNLEFWKDDLNTHRYV